MVALLAVIYIVFISLGLPDSMFGVTWPVIHPEFGLDESFASVFSIITGVCSGGVSFIAGSLLRKFGTPRVTLYSIFLTVAGLVGVSFSQNIVMMIVFTVILGWGAGAIDTGLNNYVSLHFEARHMSWLHCFWGVGVTLSPIILSFFLNDGNSWRDGYRVIALIQALIALTVLLYFKKWKKYDDSAARGQETDTEKNAEKTNVFKIRGVVCGVLSLGFYCAMEFLIGTWGSTYLINSDGFAADAAARVISIYYGGLMLGRLISGFVSMKVGDNALIRGGIVISAIGMIVLILPIGMYSAAGLLLIGLGFAPVFPSVLHSIPVRYGQKYSADITGIHMGGAYTLGFAAQLAFGYIATATSFYITPFVLFGFCALCFAANELAVRKTK